MIIYAKNTNKPPAWIQGAPNLAMRKIKDTISFGIGKSWFLGYPPKDAVILDDGWRCWVNEDGPETESLFRNKLWYRYGYSPDGNGNLWNVPVILNHDGERDFRVSYGSDWKPLVTPLQELLIGYAKEAKLFLSDADKVGKMVDPAPGCAWAAKFLEEGMFLSSEVIAKLNLMDDVLMVGTLTTASSRVVNSPVEHLHG
jgi:hypothetical protein